jgi:Xaa-Pro aminopeptidase
MFETRFQSFTESVDPSHGKARVAALRKELKARKLDGFIIPRSDEQQNEYVPPCAERLAWLTGFTGSAGTAIVLEKKAAVFIDGRYTLQVRDQVDVKIFTPVAVAETSPDKWLEQHAGKGARIGYDPSLHTRAQVKRLASAAQSAGAELVAVDTNPLDVVWADRPAPPLAPVSLHPKKYAGEEAGKKLARIEKALTGVNGLLLSDSHSVAWAFNIRGSDVAHTPLPLSYALLVKGRKPRLYIEDRKLDAKTRAALSKVSELCAPDQLARDLRGAGEEGLSLRFDAATASEKLVAALEKAGGTADIGTDPVALMKARKNAAELEGARAAHLRDGLAMVRFLAWLDTAAPSGRITEIDAVAALETFRRESGALKDVSFPTISGAGPNGAIVHYRVTEKTDRKIGKGFFLIDSGGQYEDGTTDITRTICIGKPSAEMRDRYTRVLRGHIAIARASFPKGTNGAQLDALARVSLWEAGLDFDHGTGHGVGSYLSVHEGPQRISKVSNVALEPGMILSNEPGYYKTGAYGIRLENLVVVKEADIKGAERTMYDFETLTLVPFDTSCLERLLLNRFEVAWINEYHARVYKALAPHLDRKTKAWLKKATAKV